MTGVEHFLSLLLQVVLLLAIAPLITGFIKNWKAKLQNRVGCPVWQVYLDIIKFLRKDMVISEHSSWVFCMAPYVIFLTPLLAGLLVPMISAQAPLALFGGGIALIGLLALGRFFLALGGLDVASTFGGMGSSREMALSSVAEPALMLSLFTLAITSGSTSLEIITQHSIAQMWPMLSPAYILAFASLFILLLAETGRIPVDNPATHLELTMIHEAMILEYSGRYLALVELGASVKQLVLMTLLVNVFFPVGLGQSLQWYAIPMALLILLVKLLLLAAAIVLVETVNAKLRLFRVPHLLSGAFVLAALALLSIFIFQ